ncbi:MAG: SGNH/GDSL hydrolase family protein [Verrucomicrobia bacterium]|nr:SGNH/GDSL hydrolase family protein [Verrucomicrobiota bacterium]
MMSCRWIRRALSAVGAACVGLVPAPAPAAAPQAPAPYAEPVPPADSGRLGRAIQRTMTLLATSTPQHRNRVRILFYGQSVTAGPWSHALADDVRRQYPDADLEIENRAIGGYEAPVLIKTADYDLYPFYPDLLIFHVWGGVKSGEQEEIIRRVRQRTTAEILVWTTHFRFDPKLPRETPLDHPDIAARTQADEEKSALYRDLAAKYGLELAEVREALRAHLRTHGLYPKDTLNDSVHPNGLGNFLLRKLIEPYLRYDPNFPRDAWQGLVTEIPTTDPRVERRPDGSMRLIFNGNRVDVLAGRPGSQAPGTARVRLDGRAPSTFPELTYHARPNPAPHVWWPAVNRFGNKKPLLVETWTLTPTTWDTEKKEFRFALRGSVTGPDGEGDAGRRFVSHSGRVVIEPGDWMIQRALEYSKKPMPAGYAVTWEARPLHVDTYRAPGTPDAGREYPTTLVQGVPNQTHVLELLSNGDGPVPVAAFRVYRPPLPPQSTPTPMERDLDGRVPPRPHGSLSK